MAKGIVTQDNPSIIRLSDLEPHEIQELTNVLSYTSKTKQYDFKRLKNNRFLKNKVGSTKFNQILQEAEKKIQKNLLNKDNLGFYTYSGFKDLLTSSGIKITNKIEYPDPDLIPWSK